jgi:site-specific DNA-methyltransferase (adenine-specific)
VELAEYVIETYSNENDLVLDHCAGGGTTLVAAEKLKRRWIGIEQSAEYCSWIIERFKTTF